jgi:hypothetical protein
MVAFAQFRFRFDRQNDPSSSSTGAANFREGRHPGVIERTPESLVGKRCPTIDNSTGQFGHERRSERTCLRCSRPLAHF